MAEGTLRSERMVHGDRVLWVKRPEKLSGRMRWQKGDPGRSFRDEKAGYLRLLENRAPVTALVAIGDDFYAMEDSGASLREHLWSPPENPDIAVIVDDAASALGRLHALGLVHGRPAMKDICWKDGQVTFIDFERTLRAAPGIKGQTQDVIIFFFSLFSDGAARNLAEGAREAYIAESGHEVYDHARRLMRRFRWLQAAMSPVFPLLKDKRDFAAIAPLFDFFLR